MPIRSYGFSLLELMTVVTLMSLALFPLMRDGYLHQRGELLKNEIVSVVQFAQRTALRSGQVIGVCHGSEALTCRKEFSGNILIFNDKYHNGSIRDAEQILYEKKIGAEAVQVRWQFFPYYRDYIQIRPQVVDMTDNGAIWVSAGRHSWHLLMNKSGRLHA